MNRHAFFAAAFLATITPLRAAAAPVSQPLLVNDHSANRVGDLTRCCGEYEELQP
jgi:hypothetical protein